MYMEEIRLSGFDCSGFVNMCSAILVLILKGLPQVRQSRVHGFQGSIAARRPVFFDTDGGHNYINHSGIYIGDGKFIHASSGSGKKSVVISDLTSGFYATLI